VQKGRKESSADGGRTRIIQEPGNRTIIKQDNRIIIQHDEAERFRRRPDARTERRPDGVQVTFFDRPGGVRVITEVDSNGRLLRRYRRGPDGREVQLIDNRRFYRNVGIGVAVGVGIGIVALNLARPHVSIPRERYIVEYDRARDADRDTDRRQAESPGQDEATEIGRVSAKGNAQRQLFGALRDGRRHHAVQTDRREHQRHSSEHHQHRHPDALRRGRAIDLITHRDQLARRDVRIERVDFADERRPDAGRAERRADVQADRRCRVLRKRNVEVRPRRLEEVA